MSRQSVRILTVTVGGIIMTSGFLASCVLVEIPLIVKILVALLGLLVVMIGLSLSKYRLGERVTIFSPVLGPTYPIGWGVVTDYSEKKGKWHVVNRGGREMLVDEREIYPGWLPKH